MNYLYFLYVEFLSKHGIPEIIANITFYIIPVIIVFTILLTMILIIVLAERKLLGYFTQRKGPNRVGLWGILQTIADAFKLLCKENITPDGADKFLFNLAPVLIFVPIPVAIGLIPLSSEFTFMNFSTNILLYIFLATLPVLCILLAGYSSNNKYSLIGAMRNIAQILAYELPIAFTVLSVSVLASSLNLTQIIQAQYTSKGIFGWFFMPCFIGFIIMLISTAAENNRCPFDLPEAESELICGYNTEYSGMRFAMLYLAEYSMLFVNALFVSVLFCGGYLSPFGKYLSTVLFSDIYAQIFIYFEQVIWLFLKAFFIIFIFIWFRATFPRLASFDLLKFSWCVLLPLSMINFLIVILIKMSGGIYA